MASRSLSSTPAARLTGAQVYGLILTLLLVCSSGPWAVTAFSVGGSAARRDRDDLANLDLVDALSLLQRQRRRVGSRDILFEDRLQPPIISPEDVGDWLDEVEGGRAFDEADLSSILGGLDGAGPWAPVGGEFKQYNDQSLTVKPSAQEMEDIFSNNDDGVDSEEDSAFAQERPRDRGSIKKRKLESGSAVAGVRPERKKKSVDDRFTSSAVRYEELPSAESVLSSSESSAPSLSNNEDDTVLSLDTLTEEEFKALMKAVGKLQKQVTAKRSKTMESNIEIDASGNQDEIGDVTPATEEELQSLFEDDDSDSGIENDSPGNVYVEESKAESISTPEGERRVLEVHTPEGGRRITEVNLPDGEKQVLEESLPEASPVSVQNIKEVLEDSERELSDALASQLEEDISREVAKEEQEAQVAAEKQEEVAEEEAEAEKEAAEYITAAHPQAERDDIVTASKQNIPRQIGAKNLEELEKIWMAESDLDGSRPLMEKRTTKRAASNPRTGLTARDLSNIDLQKLLANSNINDIIGGKLYGEAVLESLSREAAAEREEQLEEEEIEDAMDAIAENSMNSGNEEDIVYGSPLTGDEYVNDEDSESDSDLAFGLAPDSLSLAEQPSAVTELRRQITKERLQELAEKLSLYSDELDSVEESDAGDLEPTDSNDDTEEDDIVEPISDFNNDEDEATDLMVLPAESSRSGSEQMPEKLSQFAARISELEKEVGQLRLVAGLADYENDVLTDALNEATMAQGPGTVTDMEFGSLQRAILVEKELQKLKNAGAMDIHDTGSLSPAPPASETRKRGEPWRRKRGKTVPAMKRSRVTSASLSPSPSYRARLEPVSRSEMADILGDMSYSNKRMVLKRARELDGAEEDVIASIFLEDAGQCPAVREYSTNCELADIYALPVDFEARALCNLHEMCYACGNSLLVSQSTCDDVYRTTSATLCSQDEACMLEAEIFLRTMKLKTRYAPHQQPGCRSSCTAAFLGIL